MTKELHEILDIGHIAVIMGYNLRDDQYDKMNQELKIGMIDITYKLSEWSLEFYELYKDVDWEEVLMGESSFFPTKITCWDDAITHFMEQKIEKL